MAEGKVVPTATGTTLTDLVDDWKRSLVRADRSPSTVKAYADELKSFLRYLRPLRVNEPRALTRQHIEGWQDQIALHRHTARSRSISGTALRQFLLWAERRYNPFAAPNLWMDVAGVSLPEISPNPLTDSDFNKLRSYIWSLPPTLINLRDRALFLALVGSGAQVGEVLQLKRRDLSRISTVKQRGRQRRTLAIPANVQTAIAEYIAQRVDDSEAMWVTVDEKGSARMLTAQQARGIWRKLASRSGVPAFTSRQLRQTAAMKFFEAGVSETVIAEQLGNKSTDGLRGYKDIIAKRRREALDAIQSTLGPPPSEA